MFSVYEIEHTRRMFEEQNLDVRTITVGIDITSCASSDVKHACERIYDKICRVAGRLVAVTEEIRDEYGIPIVHNRVSVTPVSVVASSSGATSYLPYAEALDRAAKEVGIDYIGGFSALVQKGISRSDAVLMKSIPSCLLQCEKVCCSLNLASSQAGINMDAVRRSSEIILEAAAGGDGSACAKFVVFANVPEDNPFMAGAFHGSGEPEAAVHVGVSGPGAVYTALKDCPDASLDEVSDVVKRISFQITRAGQLVASQAAKRLGMEQGIVDLSLAPTPEVGDSIAKIIEAMGLSVCGAHGSTAALALLNDAIKKGGLMASSRVGGLSGSFLPVSEDMGMAAAVEKGALSLAKLEAMTAVCSVGLDMIVLPGDISSDTLSGIIADEMAIGVVNHKTTAARLIPATGKKEGEWLEFGGLLGKAPVLGTSEYSSEAFVRRGGRIPPPLSSFRN